MARTPNGYWEKRQTELMLRLERGTEKTIESLAIAYNKAQNDIQREIAKVFNKYSTDGKLTKKEALELLSSRETKQFYNNLLEQINSINDVDIKRKLLAKYNAPAYAYRISRYQALQDNIDIELKKLAEIEKTVTTTRYVDTINETYYRNIFNTQQGLGFAFSFAQIDNRTIQLMLAENWVDDANFSKRIWKNNEKLGNYLSTNMLADNMSGKSIQKMSKELSEYMNVGLYNATTLVRTEVNHFANEAEMLSYEELDIEKYRFIATLDNTTCKNCARLDNRVFNVKDRKSGRNYPPIHPNDRCTTVAVFDDVIDGLTRRARDENGKSILVPQNMTYKEWYDEYVNKDESFKSRLFGNSDNKTFKDITYQKDKLINNAFNNLNIRKIASNNNIKQIIVSGNKSYHKKGILNFKTAWEKDNFENKMRTIRHETGHAIDYQNNRVSKGLIRAINKDKQTILKHKIEISNVLNNPKYYEYAEMSDIIGGITKNKIVGVYKHPKKYWNKQGSLEREIFANLFSIAGKDDLKYLQVVDRYLHNTLRAFDNIIRRL